jgi:hypothetical protein
MKLHCHFYSLKNIIKILRTEDCLCGLGVRVPGYRSRDLGSIPGATRLSEK